MQAWSSEITNHLVLLKRQGVPFEDAWQLALKAVPPRGSEFRGMPQAMNLIDAAAEPDMVTFTRTACEDAWHGRRPALKGLSRSILDLDGTPRTISKRRVMAA